MTALRALMIELGLTDNVTNRLRGLDSQIDGIESGIVGTQKEFGALEKATQEYGHVAGKEIEGVGKEVSELDKQVEEHADVTKKATDDAGKSWAKLGAAIGGVALGFEMFVRAQQGYYVTAAKISQITGMQRDEVVGLAVELTNISNSIGDAYGVMEVGARQGLRSRDDLAAYVQVWDSIGTASGESAIELAQAAVSLRSVGIDATNLADSYDTLGFVMSHTTSSVSEFLRLTGYMAKDMDAYGMEISDVAVILASLEEKGLGAADAKRALRSAMSSAKGDTRALYRELGITADQLSRLNDEVAGGADYIKEMGDAYNGAQSPLQYLQVEAAKISNLLGADLNPVIGVASATLTGLSTALLTAATAKYVFADASIKALIPSLAASTASAWAFTAALLANPLTWVVLGIVGLIAALYLLHTRWDDISGWFMDRWKTVSTVVSGAIDWIRGAWDSTVGAIVAGANWLIDHMGILAFLFPVTAPIGAMNLLRDNWDTVVAGIGAGWDTLVGAAQAGVEWLSEAIGNGLAAIVDLFWQYHPLGIVIRQWDEITGYLKGIDLFEIGQNILLGLIDGILNVRQKLFDMVKGVGEGILDSITGFFGIRSPSKLMEQMGEYIGQGFAVGLDRSMPDTVEIGVTARGLDRAPYPGAIQYSSGVALPEIRNEPGEVQYVSVVTAPPVGDIVRSIIYRASVDEPTIRDLTGQAEYQGVLSEPTIPDMTGSVVYRSLLTEPFVGDLSGEVLYSATMQEVEPARLAGEVAYQATVMDPAVTDVTGDVAYRATIGDLTVPVLAGETVYTSSLAAPVVTDLAGVVAYRSTVDTPAIEDLVGRVMYRSQVDDVAVGDLTGNVAYRATIGDLTVPTLAGATVYTSSLTEPPVGDLTGRVAYRGLLSEPPVDDLDGMVRYGALVEEAAPEPLTGETVYRPYFAMGNVPALAGDAVYSSTVVEPALNTLVGAAEYQSVVATPTVQPVVREAIYESVITSPAIEPLTGVLGYQATTPEIEPLHGVVEYRGVLVDVPDIPGLESRYDVTSPQTGDTSISRDPETDMQPRFGEYAPERDAPPITGNVTGDLIYSPTIQVTVPSGDANEIATVVDRRLRQTFDRHADVYFGRQRRRMAG